MDSHVYLYRFLTPLMFVSLIATCDRVYSVYFFCDKNCQLFVWQFYGFSGFSNFLNH